MIITQTLKRCLQLARWKGRHATLYELQRQGNHRDHRARTARVALELEVQLLRLAYFTELKGSGSDYIRG